MHTEETPPSRSLSQTTAGVALAVGERLREYFLVVTVGSCQEALYPHAYFDFRI